MIDDEYDEEHYEYHFWKFHTNYQPPQREELHGVRVCHDREIAGLAFRLVGRVINCPDFDTGGNDINWAMAMVLQEIQESMPLIEYGIFERMMCLGAIGLPTTLKKAERESNELFGRFLHAQVMLRKYEKLVGEIVEMLSSSLFGNQRMNGSNKDCETCKSLIKQAIDLLSSLSQSGKTLCAEKPTRPGWFLWMDSKDGKTGDLVAVRMLVDASMRTTFEAQFASDHQ